MKRKVMAQVLVGIDADSVLAGARRFKTVLVGELARRSLAGAVEVSETGPVGPVGPGVSLVVYPRGEVYAGLEEPEIPLFVEEVLVKGRSWDRKLVPAGKAGRGPAPAPADSRRRQHYGRIVLENCGLIDPGDIHEYIGRDGYRALGEALSGSTPGGVIEKIEKAGLRGRGGAGFPTALKWRYTAAGQGEKVLICNADEGEPGTFKDRLIMEGDPHRVVEGMALAAFAIGARTGYIYIRGEYGLSLERLGKAVSDARSAGLLGRDIFGSGFDLDIELRLGAGSYVCGEETALINSMEGCRGEPRLKPPFPAESGFLGRPTCVNNVETLANVPPIVLRGPEWFRAFGTPGTPGTKVYTILGHVRRPGLVEVPMGTSLREIIFDYGGGVFPGDFKMAHLGGTAGDIMSREALDLPLAFETLQEAGHNLGSGAVLVMNESVGLPDFLACCLRFFRHESCGHCTPCRIGCRRLHESFVRLARGRGYEDELATIAGLAAGLKETAFCPMGQSVAAPIESALRYFRPELEAGVEPGRKRPRRRERGFRPAGMPGAGRT